MKRLLAIGVLMVVGIVLLLAARHSLDTPNPSDGIRCQDGTTSHSATRQGACSNHGGIDNG